MGGGDDDVVVLLGFRAWANDVKLFRDSGIKI